MVTKFIELMELFVDIVVNDFAKNEDDSRAGAMSVTAWLSAEAPSVSLSLCLCVCECVCVQ